jgi:hypothetical protein
VLEHVIGDHEVDAAAGHGRKGGGVADDGRLHQRHGIQLGIVRAGLGKGQPVGVADVRVLPDRERVLEGADFDARASEIAIRQLRAQGQHAQRIAHRGGICRVLVNESGDMKRELPRCVQRVQPRALYPSAMPPKMVDCAGVDARMEIEDVGVQGPVRLQRKAEREALVETLTLGTAPKQLRMRLR